ncbi:MAG TPA: immunoglobulin domain-containing protein, partial [Candidatus Dormibacteraeota bacterium]|nr:immunoglobulin domain-containing protein [Candidatus Dormibacteraeota bacterium]
MAIHRWLCVLWLCAGAFASSASAASCLPSPSGLSGWWPGEGNANDLASTNSGILQAGATANAVGFVGSAFGFDGTNNFIQFPDSQLFHPTTLTIEAWVRFTSLDSAGLGTSPAGEQYIVFKQNSRTTSFEGFDLGKERVSGTDRFRFIVSAKSAQSAEIYSSTTISTGVWYHVAGVRSANSTLLYVNGALERQTNVGFAQDYGTLPLYFGTSGQTSWDHKFKGTLDEVSLYNRDLSASEIAAIYNAGIAGKCGPPRILSQPQSQTVAAGTNITLTVTTTGLVPLSYQWQLSGTNLAGATSTNLTLTNVQPASSGNYRLTATNAEGYATSAIAVVTVHLPPSFTNQPASSTNLVGTTASFSASATGEVPLAYNWLFNGISLSNGGRFSGTASTSLNVSNIQSPDAGNYSLRASNVAGVVTSAVASLTVVAYPVITTQPLGAMVLSGTNLLLNVAASGTPPLNFQWQRYGTNISDSANLIGSGSASIVLNDVQPTDSGDYAAIVSNAAGSATSAVARVIITVQPIAPSITNQPASQVVGLGHDVTFTVGVVGTVPLAYQWLKDGVQLSDGSSVSGTATPTLTLHGIASSDAADYQAVVFNGGGAVTSLVASLNISLSAKVSAGAIVLVNSTSAKYVDFSHFIQPYLDNFGIPYTVQDIATNPVTTNISSASLIIIGHKQLDTNHTFLTAAGQGSISLAVSNGTGLLNFDSDLVSGGVPRYQYVQDIFGFSYTNTIASGAVTFPATEPQMHFITMRHQPIESISLVTNMTLLGLAPSVATTNIVLSGGKPLVAYAKYGNGCAVQWASYDWMTVLVLGPLKGLDDVVWRSCVWAARKPFVMRALPNFVTMRVDDVSGPFWWVHTANEVGIKPFVTMFLGGLPLTNVPDLRSLVTNGMATASPHAWFSGQMIYFDHQHETNYSDLEMSNNLYMAFNWQVTNNLPMSKVIATHYSEIGPNAFPGLLTNWGTPFVPIEIVPGQVEYGTPPAPWLVAGPYRLYETPQPGESLLPLYYADFLTIPGHPELNGKFFNVYTEIRDVGSCGQWCPVNTAVSNSIYEGTQIVKRGLDSLVLATLFTHDWKFQNTPVVQNANPISTNN